MKQATLAVVGHVGPETKGDRISVPHALAALAALGQPTRLAVFRHLIAAEPHGLQAGALAEKIGCPHNTLSSHVSILARSGLVRGTRDGRSIIYHADVDAVRSLVDFLINDCCGGHPELCDLQEAIRDVGCCTPQRSAKRPKRQPKRAGERP
jgi:ArsR family transcriptional regulator, arsenate/arsenite/antimonite-responsive transcriptional repressor